MSDIVFGWGLDRCAASIAAGNAHEGQIEFIVSGATPTELVSLHHPAKTESEEQSRLVALKLIADGKVISRESREADRAFGVDRRNYMWFLLDSKKPIKRPIDLLPQTLESSPEVLLPDHSQTLIGVDFVRCARDIATGLVSQEQVKHMYSTTTAARTPAEFESALTATFCLIAAQHGNTQEELQIAEKCCAVGRALWRDGPDVFKQSLISGAVDAHGLDLRYAWYTADAPHRPVYVRQIPLQKERGIVTPFPTQQAA